MTHDGAATVKLLAPPAASIAPAWPFVSFEMAIFIIFAQIFGIAARAGIMKAKGERLQSITDDFIVSLLVGGANFAIVLFTSEALKLKAPAIFFLGVAVAAAGSKPIVVASDWIATKAKAVFEVIFGNKG